MNKQPIFLTDGKNNIYKIEKLIKAAILKNLETGQFITAEIIGSLVTGFAIIDMPKIKDISASLSETTSGNQKSGLKKIRRNKSSQYFGVSLNKKTGKWRTSIWIDSKNKTSGEFVTEIEAAKAVDAELEKRGLPKRNFP